MAVENPAGRHWGHSTSPAAMVDGSQASLGLRNRVGSYQGSLGLVNQAQGHKTRGGCHHDRWGEHWRPCLQLNRDNRGGDFLEGLVLQRLRHCVLVKFKPRVLVNGQFSYDCTMSRLLDG